MLQRVPRPLCLRRNGGAFVFHLAACSRLAVMLEGREAAIAASPSFILVLASAIVGRHAAAHASHRDLTSTTIPTKVITDRRNDF